MADEKATETDAQTIAPAATPAPVVDDAEARYKALEEEKENYRKAYLQSESKRKAGEEPDSEGNESMEDVARRVLGESRLADIAREQQQIIDKTLKENRELKLAQLNKKEPPAVAGASTDSQPVRDTLVTADQSAALKAKGWTDKDIERYKKNLARNTR